MVASVIELLVWIKNLFSKSKQEKSAEALKEVADAVTKKSDTSDIERIINK